MFPHRPRIRWWPLLALSAVAGGILGSAQDEVIIAPPMLVNTTDGGPRWDTVAELIVAAQGGEPLAQFQYAQLLEYGDQDVTQSDKLALEYYGLAADGGMGEAIFRLGKIHHDGELGVSVNYRRALSYYRRAADAKIPEAFYNIGAMHVSARGVKRDYVEGLAWLMLAAERDSDPDDAVARVRKRLTRYPHYIDRANRRANVLRAEFSASSSPAQGGGRALGLAPAPVAAPRAEVAPVSITPGVSGFSPTVPRIAAPGITIPTPPPAATAPATPDGTDAPNERENR